MRTTHILHSLVWQRRCEPIRLGARPRLRAAELRGASVGFHARRTSLLLRQEAAACDIAIGFGLYVANLRSCGPMTFKRITVRADQMGGVPCIRGLRIPVATVVGMIADGVSREEILAAYPDLEAEDVEEALRYAAEAVRERELPLASAG
jgi:uncharacterized protein (DUF433 family)